MKGNRRTGTKPETLVRSALHARGYRFRKDFVIDAGGVRARPDVVFTRRRVAVFVDGCFWHGCSLHGVSPKTNGWYWGPKLARNVARDHVQTQALEAAGWRVLRVWEHEDVDVAVAAVEAELDSSSKVTLTRSVG